MLFQDRIKQRPFARVVTKRLIPKCNGVPHVSESNIYEYETKLRKMEVLRMKLLVHQPLMLEGGRISYKTSEFYSIDHDWPIARESGVNRYTMSMSPYVSIIY